MSQLIFKRWKALSTIGSAKRQFPCSKAIWIPRYIAMVRYSVYAYV